MAYEARMQSSLDSRAAKGTLRVLRPAQASADAPSAEESEAPCDFSSNDYLSLARSPILRQRFIESLSDNHIYGPPSSRLLDGNSSRHQALEARLATHFCAESALLFNSGYDANAGVWACLPSEFDVILYDDLIHASVHDGMRLSRARLRVPFLHNSVEAFEAALRAVVANDARIRSASADIWVSVESLYSMDGDMAPLTRFAALLDEILPRGNGHLIVDEAHATGLYGESGRGLVCELGLAHRVLIRTHTFGKSLACSGAAVLSNDLIRSYLINYARPLIYSTVMPYINVHAIDCALQMLESGECQQSSEHVHRLSSRLLFHLIDLPATPLAQLPPALPALSSPIIPILSSRAIELAEHLQASGYLVRALRFPTVPKGTERVRVTLHANNTAQHVDGLIDALHQWLQSKGVTPNARQAQPVSMLARL